MFVRRNRPHFVRPTKGTGCGLQPRNLTPVGAILRVWRRAQQGHRGAFTEFAEFPWTFLSKRKLRSVRTHQCGTARQGKAAIESFGEPCGNSMKVCDRAVIACTAAPPRSHGMHRLPSPFAAAPGALRHFNYVPCEGAGNSIGFIFE